MAYIGNSPENIQRGKRFVYEFKATAGQTVFSGTDLNNQTLDLLEENEMGVYLNGVRLADSDDYTVSGDTLTLVSAASLNDQLTVETQAEIANISSYTRAEADARYINYDGDIVAGDLQISGEVDAGSLIVDTDVLVVDATNDIVGIGTATPSTTASGYEGGTLHIHNAGTGASIRLTNSTTGTGTSAGMLISKWSDSKTYFTNFDDGADMVFTPTNSGGSLVANTFVIKSDGKIGLGTASPVYQLHVNSGATNIVADFESTDGIAGIRLRDNTGNVELSASGNDFRVQPAGGTPVFTVTGGGRVGIGTTTPPQELSVVGQINIDETDYARVEYARNTTNIWSAGLRTGNNFHIYRESGNGSVEIPSGNVLIGTTDANPVTNNVAGTSLLDGGGTRVSRSGEPGGYNRIGSDGTLINFRKDGATVGKIGTVSGKLVLGGGPSAGSDVTIDDSGNVGIGTTSPAAKLHIKTSTIAAGSDLDEIAIIADTPFVSGYQAQSASLLSGFDSTIHGTAIGMVYENPGYALTFFTNDNTSGLPIERLRINDSGNVSIGAGNAPSERLQIGGNFRAGNTGATTSFDGGGNDRYIGVSSLNGGDAMFIAHASGYGVGYFGYEPTDDKLIIACDNGGGNNKIDFSLNAGTNANGATDNLTGVWGDPELRISSTAHMVHVRGDTADTGTTGGSKGLSIYTGGGTSCPIYFGSESNSAQKSMYMTGYWIYLRGHQNEGIRFVFSQGAGNAPRSDQYQFKYNSAYRPTGNTTWDGFSDARAKENVTNLTGALDTISQLRPVTFDWTDDYADTMNMFEMDTTDEKSYNHFSVKENGYDLDRKTSQIGFIAQEFEEVFPKSITETEMQLGDTKVEDFKTVNYDHLIPVLTKAIQELKDENDALKARIEALEG